MVFIGFCGSRMECRRLGKGTVRWVNQCFLLRVAVLLSFNRNASQLSCFLSPIADIENLGVTSEIIPCWEKMLLLGFRHQSDHNDISLRGALLVLVFT